MNAYVRGLSRFRFDPSTLEKRHFQLALTGTNLAKGKNEDINDVIAKHRKIPGIYFWVMKADDAKYAIYIGQTNSIANRVKNYMASFQPDSPNDYKLQIFQAFMPVLMPDATLDLYLWVKDPPFTRKELLAAEQDEINQYNPLLNRLGRTTPEAKAELGRAFSLYFQSKVKFTLENDA